MTDTTHKQDSGLGALFERLGQAEHSEEHGMGDEMAVQVGGDHYTSMAMQPAELIFAGGLGYFEGAIVKYVSRYPRKGGVEDLRKAAHCLAMLIGAREYRRALEWICQQRAWADIQPPATRAQAAYCAANGLTDPVATVIENVCCWSDTGLVEALDVARRALYELIATEEQAQADE